MQLIFSIPFHKSIIHFKEEMAISFNYKKQQVKQINTTNGKMRIFNAKTPLVDACFSKNKIFLIQKNIVEVFDVKTNSKLFTIVVKDVKAVMIFNDNNMLFILNKQSMLYDGQKDPVRRSFHTWKQVDSYLLIIASETVELYEDGKGLVFSSTKSELLSLFNFNSDYIISFCVRNGKVYFLTESKIIGPDLNLYISDARALIKKKDKDNKTKKKENNSTDTKHSTEKNIQTDKQSFTQFLNIEEGVLLLDNEKKLRLFDKGMTKIHESIDCEAFYYSSKLKTLSVANKGVISIYKMPGVEIKEFRLVEDNIVYREAEDEFDMSNDEVCMLNTCKFVNKY